MSGDDYEDRAASEQPPSFSPTAVPGETAEPDDTPSPSVVPSVTPKPFSAPGKPAAKTATVGKVVYRILGKRAAVQKASSTEVTKITIRDLVKIGGKTYKVTSIDKNAFKNCRKLKAVTIKAKSLAVIGKNAFRGCGKLRSVKIKSKNITKAGKGAFTGIPKKATIKVPKSRIKKYKKYSEKRGWARRQGSAAKA